MNLSEVILSPLITEKGSFLKEKGVYTLKVSPRSNKILVKQAVEKMFSVKVESVRILIRKAKVSKSVTRGGRISRKASFKKAYVKVASGAKINDLEV